MQNINEPRSPMARKNNRSRNRSLSVEMILRKSFRDMLKEYVNHCSLAGVKQMCDTQKSILQRVVWITMFCTAIVTIGYFLLYIWSDTLNRPLIVTMESSTYPISEIDFPAVAVCNINRISKTALKAVAKELYHEVAKKNESLEEVEWVMLQWGRLVDFSYNETLRLHPVFVNMVEKYRFNTRQVVDMMKTLAPKCQDMLLKCSWAGKVVDCSSIFKTRRTIRGHCCAFNFILDYDSGGMPTKVLAEARRQNEPGYLYGLSVLLDPMVEDYAYPITNIQGFDVLMFDPTHFADPSTGHVVHRFAEPNMSVFYELKSTKQVATREIQKYSLKTRKCLFKDEFQKKFGKLYSYSACLEKCRTITIQSLCKCTPYYVARKTDHHVCSLDDLQCLNKYKEKLLYFYPAGAESTVGLEQEIQDSLFCADCLPDCECTEHSTKSFEIPLGLKSVKNRKHSHMHNISIFNKCLVNVYQSTPDSTLDRLDVVNYWFEILSNIGGFGGIIVGFSIISVIEMIYFLSVRYIQIFYLNYIRYR